MGKRPAVLGMHKIVPVVQAKICEGLVTQPVQVKLTATEKLYLNVLVDQHGYPTRSAALRAGLGMLMTKHKMHKSFDEAIEKERRVHPPRKGRSRPAR
jgi:Arc/MetJ-type ribon-helix-helix transcriptional regulator